MRFRLGVTFVTLLAAMTALFVWAGMAAGATKTTYIQTADPTDPQNTNIPYLAWAGETVRVTKCLNFDGLQESDLPGPELLVEWHAQHLRLEWGRRGRSEHAVLPPVQQPGPHGHWLVR